jgi:WD40 repeat protein
MTWVAHKGWCSQVQFIPPNRGCGSSSSSSSAATPLPLVLTAGGMDGVVALWDIGKSGGKSGQPLKLLSASDLHSSGIFSMHAAWGGGVWGAECVRLLTGSKDSTVSLTRIGEGGTVLERSFRGHHGGVVKCVRWRGCGGVGGGGGGDSSESNGTVVATAAPEVFASCGNDGRVCVMDVRCPPGEECVGAVDHAHGGRSVNFVEWACNTVASASGSDTATDANTTSTWSSDNNNSTNEFLLVTSGMDRDVRVWDIRRMSSCSSSSSLSSPSSSHRTPLLHALSGHVSPKVSSPKTMYHPVFVDAGGGRAAVATPGEGSARLSLYSVGDGRAVSRGEVGFDATAVLARAVIPAAGVAGAGAAGGGHGAPGGVDHSSRERSTTWTLALADKGQVRLYRPLWGSAAAAAGLP